MDFYNLLSFSSFIIAFVIVFIFGFFKAVPSGTVYIIDRNTHYLKTVKKGLFFFNPFTDKITTVISSFKITKNYLDIFETEDGKKFSINFSVTYSTKNIDDLLYNLEKVRRSIDDILESSMYNAVRNLNSKSIQYSSMLSTEFLRNLQSQAMSVGLNIDDYIISSASPVTISYKSFKPHKNYSDSGDPIVYS